MTLADMLTALEARGALPASRAKDIKTSLRYLATALDDSGTSNLWVLPTEGGPMKPVTDFGERTVVIARSVSWSVDGQSLYAAVAEVGTDIVLLNGLLG